MKSSALGFSLIEVLISMILLSFILAGFESVEIFSLRAQRAAYYFNTAVNQLNNMTERLRLLKNYRGREEQEMIWKQQNKRVLPQGRGTVSGNYPFYSMTIYWGKMHSCQQNHRGTSGCLTKKIEVSA